MTIRRSEIIDVLEELKEKKGYEYEANFQCCLSCATAAFADKYGENASKWILWHEQDDEAFDGNRLTRGMYLGWGGNGKEIVQAFRDAGIKTDWNGSKSMRIAILPERISEYKNEKTTEEKAVEELREIRDGGLFNMLLDRAQIMQHANKKMMFSLVSYCGNSREKYMEVLKQI